MTDEARREELAATLKAARMRIARAARVAGRVDPVDLVVVTKTFPATDVEILADLGVRDVGENRDQEAKAKRGDVHRTGLRWHMIGRLQSNKATSVASWADVVESVDRVGLVSRLSAGAQRHRAAGDPLEILIQVSLEEPGPTEAHSGRGGASPSEISAIAEAVAQAQPWLRLGGLMAVAPHPDSGIAPDRAFARLARIAEEFRERWPGATTLSAGMSGDLEAAVQAGATQVRIGGAILGQRAPVQ